MPALYAIDDIGQLPLAPSSQSTMRQWLQHYLAEPHPQLGRRGPVCPYVGAALEQHTIWLTVIPTEGLSHGAIARIVRPFRQHFHALAPRSGWQAQLKAILLLFPDIQHEQAPALIDRVQHDLKPSFVEAGLMIGQFHARNMTPGVHNRAFHPLRSPIPLLAIRFMVEKDLPFLHQEADAPAVRIRFLRAYLRHFGAELHSSDRQRAHEALQQAEQERAGGGCASTG